MKYEHYIITKQNQQDLVNQGKSSWLTNSDFDSLANGHRMGHRWLLVTVIQVDDLTREYVFRREVKG